MPAGSPGIRSIGVMVDRSYMPCKSGWPSGMRGVGFGAVFAAAFPLPCAANGIDSTIHINNNSGSFLGDIGSNTDSTSTTLNPFGPNISNGAYSAVVGDFNHWVGRGHAMRLALGYPLPAKEAHRIGLANHVVPAIGFRLDSGQAEITRLGFVPSVDELLQAVGAAEIEKFGLKRMSIMGCSSMPLGARP
jgi:hypothetical protein